MCFWKKVLSQAPANQRILRALLMKRCAECRPVEPSEQGASDVDVGKWQGLNDEAVQLGSVLPDLLDGESFRLARARIVLVVVVETQKDKVVAGAVRGIAVEVCDLASLLFRGV